MIAQTNLQLTRQLHAAGYSGEDIAAVQRAYEFALPAFSAQYRASGKPFVAHLVGTTSVLAAQGERADMLLAGLLHAVYSNGDLGVEPGKRQSPRRRQHVRTTAGVAAEALIAAYDDSQWHAPGIHAWCVSYAHLSALEKDLVKLHLANTLDDFIDGGMCLPTSQKSRLYSTAAVQGDIESLARLVHWDTVADELKTAFAEFNAASTHLPTTRGRGTASLRLPPSATRRLVPRLQGFLNRRLRRLKRKSAI